MFHVCSKAEKLYEVRDELLLNKNKPMKFKIRFHLYIHNKCVAFKKHFCCHSRCVCVLSIQNEAAAHHMHCCTDLKSIFCRPALISLNRCCIIIGNAVVF